MQTEPQTLPRVPWSDFLANHFDWQQGEHVSLIGPTGTGKTTLGRALLPKRKYVVALGTKPRDPTLSELMRRGYTRFSQWPPPPPRTEHDDRRYVLWPKVRKMDDIPHQRAVFLDALHAMFTEGGWCIFADETRYLCQTLGMERTFRLLWLQGRSLDLSLVCATQRPAWVPLELYDQATHVFLWRDNDRRNLDRLRELAGIGPDSVTLRETVATLPLHDVLYLNTRTGQQCVTRAEL